jgi:hypothetical protein
LILVDPAGVVVGPAGVVVDPAGAVVDPAGAVVDPAGVAVWSQPTQAISIAVTKMMRLSRCMRTLRSLLSWGGALGRLAYRLSVQVRTQRVGKVLLPEPPSGDEKLLTR